MPGAGRTHGPPANKKAGGSHHGFSQISRHSLRNGFNGVLRALPGTGLYCLRHCAVRHRTTWCQRRGTRTTRFRRPRRHRSSANTRYARHRVHRIPAPRIVTISRNAPLGERGTGRIMLLISGKVKLLRKIRTSSVNSASRPARRCPAHWHVARTCVHARDRRRAPPHPCVPRPR